MFDKAEFIKMMRGVLAGLPIGDTHQAVVAGWITMAELDELLDPFSDLDYEVLRAQLYMFLLLAEGEEL